MSTLRCISQAKQPVKNQEQVRESGLLRRDHCPATQQRREQLSLGAYPIKPDAAVHVEAAATAELAKTC